MNWIFKVPVFVTIWAAYLLVKIPTALSGFLVVPFLWKYRDTDYLNLPYWTKPWANPEDWDGGPSSYESSLPKWWVDTRGKDLKAFYQYHAIRNPANGLRSFEFMDLDIDPKKVEFRTNKEFVRYEPNTLRAWDMKLSWYFAWQGWRAGMKFIYIWNDERHAVIKFGWRVEPSDAKATDTEVMGLADASFASKVLPYRKG